MTRLCLNFLGTFRVTLDGTPVTGFESDKVRALLAYPAVESDRPQRREMLAGLLWPDMAERDARTNLRQALANLRKVLGDRESAQPFINVTRQTIQFNDVSDAQVDVRHFTRVIEETASHAHDNLENCQICISRLQEAVQHYQGEFLEGFSLDSDLFEGWVVVQREKLHIQVLDVLDHLAAYHEGKGEYGNAQDYAQRQVELEPWRESAYRQLMRAYALSGQRGMALTQYETCRRVLEEELGIEPEVETTQLYEQIRRGEFQKTSQISREAAIQEPSADPPVPPDFATTVMPVEVRTPVRPQAPTQMEGERRVVTALSAILKGSTKLQGDVDLETWAEMMLDVLPILENKIQHFGGEVNQVRDDGLVVLFGLTAAHEDDPERAVLAALAMQEEIECYAADLPIELTLQVGINTGEVIATSIGNQSNRSTALGGVPGQAELVGEAAEPGTVLAAESTYRLIESLFTWQMLGRFQMRGVRGPVAVYRPLEYIELPTKGRGIEGLASPLVGRDQEFQALQEAVDHLRAGIGGIVTIVGEAGIGKSRLVAEVKSTVCKADITWLEGRCLSYATNIAYQVWLDMLGSWLEAGVDISSENIVDVLKAQVREVCGDLFGEVFPFLARLLSLPLDEVSAARLRGIDAGGIQVLTFRAFETLIEHISTQHPLTLVCEDLHWGDPTSLHLLEYLLPLTDSAPLLLVCVMRPVTTHGCWQIRELAARDYRHRNADLWLYPLNSTESEMLVGNLLHIEDLPPDLRRRITQRAEGNPYFLEEILRSLIEEEAIVYDAVIDLSTGDKVNRWVAPGEIADLRTPDTLIGVLTARIDRLEFEVKRVLQLASVIGRSFSYRVLAAIAENGDIKELDAYLITLQRAQLVREKARLPESEYIFKHVLTQEAAYNGLLKRERRSIHRKVAEVIERLYADNIEERLGLLAYHWEQAGETEQAVHYLRRAGEQAAAQYANAEAVDYFSRALNLVLDEDIATRYVLLVFREAVYDLQGKRELQKHDLAILASLAKRLDEINPLIRKSRLAEIGLRQTRLAIRKDNRYDVAAELAQNTLKIAREFKDKFAEAAAYREWGKSIFWMGERKDAFLKLEQALAIARGYNFREVEEGCLNDFGHYYRQYDSYDKAKDCFEQQLKVCREVGSRSREGVALRRLARIFCDQGAYDKALSYAIESLQVCRETGNRREEGWALWLIGRIYFYQDCRKHNVIKDYFIRALKIFREVEDTGGIANTYDLLTMTAQRLGDDIGEMRYIEEALTIFRQTGNTRFESAVLNWKGWLLFRQGRYSKAQHCTEQAYRIVRELGTITLQFHPLCNLGRLFFVLGDYKRSKQYSEESLVTACEKEMYSLECEALIQLGFTAHAEGDDAIALEYGQRVLTLLQENTNIYRQSQANLILGLALSGLGEWEVAGEAYQESIRITEHQEFNETSVEAKAGLSRLKLIRGDPASSLVLVEDILQYMEEKPQLRDTFEPFRIYLTCIQVLQANHDPRAQEVLEQAYNLLQERAATIEDEALHRSYLKNVAENREIVALWEKYHQNK